MDKYVLLAKQAIEQYVKNGSVIKNDFVLEKYRSGCFVSIHKKSGELRGCIGTILPTCKDIGAEIIGNAIAATTDSRFNPVEEAELPFLDYSVDILSEPEPIASPKSLDPKKYGVIVKAKDGRTGVLLPDLEGIDEAMYQVAIAREKAGIAPDEPIFLYRFSVQRHKDS